MNTRSSSLRQYLLVFVILAAITAVEIVLSSSSLGLGRGLTTPLFLVLSLSKASLVAAFYMHLRSDRRMYAYIFLLPVVLLVMFAYLMVVS